MTQLRRHRIRVKISNWFTPTSMKKTGSRIRGRSVASDSIIYLLFFIDRENNPLIAQLSTACLRNSGCSGNRGRTGRSLKAGGMSQGQGSALVWAFLRRNCLGFPSGKLFSGQTCFGIARSCRLRVSCFWGCTCLRPEHRLWIC